MKRPANDNVRAPYWTDGEAELRLGRWQDVTADVTADVVICDPPYGGRVHIGSRANGNARADGVSLDGIGPTYAAWSGEDVRAFVAAWAPRCRGWIVALTSHDLIGAWLEAHESAGRYCFAPVPCVMRGMTVRLCGDGPSSWAVYAMVARPSTKAFATWGTLDGAYTGPPSTNASGGRGKPAWLMQALVRDYSKLGDLIVDPFAGWGATCEAARALGRRSIGIEMDGEAIAEARRRLERPVQTGMFL